MLFSILEAVVKLFVAMSMYGILTIFIAIFGFGPPMLALATKNWLWWLAWIPWWLAVTGTLYTNLIAL